MGYISTKDFTQSKMFEVGVEGGNSIEDINDFISKYEEDGYALRDFKSFNNDRYFFISLIKTIED